MVTGPTFVGTGQWPLPHLAPEYTELHSGLQGPPPPPLPHQPRNPGPVATFIAPLSPLVGVV